MIELDRDDTVLHTCRITFRGVVIMMDNIPVKIPQIERIIAQETDIPKHLFPTLHKLKEVLAVAKVRKELFDASEAEMEAARCAPGFTIKNGEYQDWERS